MLLVRILLGLLLGYAVLVLLAWVFQERIAFPAPRAPVPDPRQVGAANGERIELVLRDGTKLAGWYLAPRSPTIGRPPWPALLWFYGNGENIASIGGIVRDFQPPCAGGRGAAAAGGGGAPAALVVTQGAGHNDTYDLGGEAYRRKLWQFVLGGAVR